MQTKHIPLQALKKSTLLQAQILYTQINFFFFKAKNMFVTFNKNVCPWGMKKIKPPAGSENKSTSPSMLQPRPPPLQFPDPEPTILNSHSLITCVPALSIMLSVKDTTL